VKFRVTFTTQAEIAVVVEVDDADPLIAADEAGELAHQRAEKYLQALGDHQGITVVADLDGIGYDTIEETS